MDRTMLLAAIALLSAPPPPAQALILSSYAQGWINIDGVISDAGNPDSNYLAGNCDVANCDGMAGEFRNWFLFAIPLLASAPTSARLHLDTFVVDTRQNPSVVYTLTSTASLTFADLGTGTVYGARTYTADDSWTELDIELNDGALAAISTGGLTFAVSGRVTSSTQFGPQAPNQQVFAYSNGTQHLLLDEPAPVPLPASLPFVGSLIGVAGCAVARRRRS